MPEVEPTAVVELIERFPELIVVRPVYELLPVSVSVPAPDLVRLPEPPIVPETVTLPTALLRVLVVPTAQARSVREPLHERDSKTFS